MPNGHHYILILIDYIELSVLLIFLVEKALSIFRLAKYTDI